MPLARQRSRPRRCVIVPRDLHPGRQICVAVRNRQPRRLDQRIGAVLYGDRRGEFRAGRPHVLGCGTSSGHARRGFGSTTGSLAELRWRRGYPLGRGQHLRQRMRARPFRKASSRAGHDRCVCNRPVRLRRSPGAYSTVTSGGLSAVVHTPVGLVPSSSGCTSTGLCAVTSASTCTRRVGIHLPVEICRASFRRRGRQLRTGHLQKLGRRSRSARTNWRPVAQQRTVRPALGCRGAPVSPSPRRNTTADGGRAPVGSRASGWPGGAARRGRRWWSCARTRAAVTVALLLVRGAHATPDGRSAWSSSGGFAALRSRGQAVTETVESILSAGSPCRVSCSRSGRCG